MQNAANRLDVASATRDVGVGLGQTDMLGPLVIRYHHLYSTLQEKCFEVKYVEMIGGNKADVQTACSDFPFIYDYATFVNSHCSRKLYSVKLGPQLAGFIILDKFA